MKKSIILISLILSLITAQPGGFSVPNAISFQGMLTNADGSVYQDGDYGLTFRFIRTMQDGSEQVIWEEAHTASVSSGVFSVILGSNTPLPQYISGNAMLETQVGDEILSPRQPFTSVPFSLRSNGAQFSEQALRSDSANFAQMSHHSVFADTSAFALNAPTAINATHANYADTSMFAGQAGQAVHATYADTSMFAGQAGQTVHATYADSAGFVDLSGLILPESFVSYAQEDITLPTSWTSIYTMTISISANMKLHTKAFIYRTPVDGGGFGGQLAIADQNGNILEAPASSARFPTTFENTLYSDYVFDVTPGTYIIALFGVGNGTDLAESVFIEVLAMPSSGNRQLNNLELIENNFPYTDGEPIRLSN